MTASARKSEALSPRQYRAIGYLMSEPTIIAAARKTRVAERTLRRWIEDPVFASAYRTARRQALAHTTARLQDATADAVAMLKTLMADDETPRSSRVMAARTILEFGYRADDRDMEEQLNELQGRLREIETHLLDGAR